MTSLTTDRVADRGSPTKCWLYHQLLELWASVHVKPWGCVFFSRGRVRALDNLSFDVEPGRIRRQGMKLSGTRRFV